MSVAAPEAMGLQLFRRSGRFAGFITSCVLVAMCAWAAVAHAAEGDIVAIPALSKRVTDLTATLSSAEEALIEARLKEFEAKKGAQVAVLIVGSTQPETIFDFSVRVTDAWKLGRKDVDDGVLFVVAKNDRKLQILTGRGVQGTLTDAMSKRIIGEVVAPKFRANDFAGGIEDGVAKIIDVLQGEALPPPQKKRVAVQQGTNIESFLVLGVLAALFVGPLLRSLLGRFLGASATGGVTGFAAWVIAGGMVFPIVAGIIIFFVVMLMGAMNFSRGGRGGFSTGGWSGGGSSGGSSDSFSGGGGGFDGGGASGDW